MFKQESKPRRFKKWKIWDTFVFICSQIGLVTWFLLLHSNPQINLFLILSLGVLIGSGYIHNMFTFFKGTYYDGYMEGMEWTRNLYKPLMEEIKEFRYPHFDSMQQDKQYKPKKSIKA